LHFSVIQVGLRTFYLISQVNAPLLHISTLQLIYVKTVHLPIALHVKTQQHVNPATLIQYFLQMEIVMSVLVQAIAFNAVKQTIANNAYLIISQLTAHALNAQSLANATDIIYQLLILHAQLCVGMEL
jgi:hypothetical protein